ncbi:hydrogenase formation protein HypD [Geotalea toluenoxydans]
MNYVKIFGDKEIVNGYAERIEALIADLEAPLTLMEVCGTHTMAISRFGIRSLLPPKVRLISGPGCPVCVTPNHYLDRAIALSRLPHVIIATFGDMMRVSGSSGSLMEERASGADIRIVNSPLDGVALAARNPDRKIIFPGIGFEATAPAVAASILMAARQKLDNYLVLAGHKTMPKAMEMLAAEPAASIDGFICPAHVSAIIGTDAYLPLAERHHIPCVVTGFEPADIMQGVEMLIRQKIAGEAKVENQYRRVVKRDGNSKAREVMSQVFIPCDCHWRGIGIIPGSGLKIRRSYARFDAEKALPVKVEEQEEQKGCRCGDVLKGKIQPLDCPLFGTQCTPENPVGPCMVSSEGSCAAYYNH